MKRILSLLLCLPALVWAESRLSTDQIKAKLNEVVPEAKVESIQDSPIPGLYQVVVGMEVAYISADGKFLIQGEILNLDKTGFNHTEAIKKNLRSAKIKTIQPKDEIAFNAPHEKYVAHVFTDVDCGYCRMLHSEIKKYNDLGISIRYLAFPRQGLDSAGFKKMESVWCADNKAAALTNAKNNQPIPEKTCNASVKKDFELGVKMGVTGTPSILLEDGTFLGGYVPPEGLLAVLKGDR